MKVIPAVQEDMPENLSEDSSNEFADIENACPVSQISSNTPLDPDKLKGVHIPMPNELSHPDEFYQLLKHIVGTDKFGKAMENTSIKLPQARKILQELKQQW